MTQQATTTDELAFLKPSGTQEQQVLTAEAVEFLTELVTRFTPKRNKLLAARIQQQQGSRSIQCWVHIPQIVWRDLIDVIIEPVDKQQVAMTSPTGLRFILRVVFREIVIGNFRA